MKWVLKILPFCISSIQGAFGALALGSFLLVAYETCKQSLEVPFVIVLLTTMVAWYYRMAMDQRVKDRYLPFFEGSYRARSIVVMHVTSRNMLIGATTSSWVIILCLVFLR